jgi:cell division protein FtsQ
MATQRRGASMTQSDSATTESRRWYQSLLPLVVMASLVIGVVYLYQVDTLPVKHVSVEGELRHLQKQDLIEAVSPYVTGSFFSIDVAQVQSAGQALPWVNLLQVRRTWPDGLHLIVHEQEAAAVWNGHALLNTKGQVFKPTLSSFPTGLVAINGPDGMNHMMAKRWVDIQQQVDALGLTVTQLTMDARRAWQLSFDNGLLLKLGREHNEDRLERFIDVYQGALSGYHAQIEAIDMRYTNGLAVVWVDGQAPQFDGTV